VVAYAQAVDGVRGALDGPDALATALPSPHSAARSSRASLIRLRSG
jgi:hypothetical protein